MTDQAVSGSSPGTSDRPLPGDPCGMGAVLERFVDDLTAAGRLADGVRLRPRVPRALVVLGMGGSAIAGDLLAALWRDVASFPVHVIRGYSVPAWVDRETLVIASSYSGETEETLGAYSEARRRGADMLAMTTGGALAALAARDGLATIRLPAGLQPRAALPYSVAPLVAVVARAYPELAPAGNPAEAAAQLGALAESLGPRTAPPGNLAKQLAAWLGARTPAVYGTDVTAAVAQRWRSQMEENAKRLALAGEIPEMNHNAIEAWGTLPAGQGATWAVLLLRDHGEHARVARRAALVGEVIGARAEIREVWSVGSSRLARLLSLVLVGDWVSYYVALAAGVDPWPVPTLEAFKHRLRGDVAADG